MNIFFAVNFFLFCLVNWINTIYAADFSKAPNRSSDFIIVSKEGHKFKCSADKLKMLCPYWGGLVNGGFKESRLMETRLGFSQQAIEIILNNAEQQLIKSTFSSISDELAHELLGYIEMIDDLKLARAFLSSSKNEDKIPKAWEQYLVEQITHDNQFIIESLSNISEANLFKLLEKNHRPLFIKIRPDCSFILDMASWSKEEAETILADKQYISTQITLIQQLEKKIIDRAKALRIDKPAHLASFFLAHDVANISTGWNAALTVASAFWKEWSENASSWTDIWCSARKATRDAAYSWDNANITAFEAAWYAAYDDAWKATDQTVKKVLPKLGLVIHDEIAKASWKLSSLYVLAYIAQDEFQNTFFQTAHNAAYKKLEPNFNLSKDDVVKTIADNTWLKSDELAKNPYIASLRKIVESIAKQIP